MLTLALFDSSSPNKRFLQFLAILQECNIFFDSVEDECRVNLGSILMRVNVRLLQC